MRRRGSKLQSLGDILQSTLKKNRIAIPLEDRQLKELWIKAAGPQIAAQTHPDSLKRGTLCVKVSSSVWMHHLHFLKQDIIDKLNGQEGKEFIKNIRFILGEIPRPPAAKAKAEPLPWRNYALREKDKKLIEKSTAVVQDEELKELLKQVMAKELRRRRFMEGRKER